MIKLDIRYVVYGIRYCMTGWRETSLPFPCTDVKLTGGFVFGRVLSGLDVVYNIEAEGTQSGTPKSKVVIVDSGELPL